MHWLVCWFALCDKWYFSSFVGSFFARPGEKRTCQGNEPMNITLIIPALNEAACIAPLATTDYQQIMLGNVFERPLAEVWNDPPYQDLRAAVLGDSPAPWPCQHYGVRWSL
jgi:hypothetical protein